MPNHVTHKVTVSGTSRSVEAFFNTHFAGENLDFNTILPMPEILRDTVDSSLVKDILIGLIGPQAVSSDRVLVVHSTWESFLVEHNQVYATNLSTQEEFLAWAIQRANNLGYSDALAQAEQRAQAYRETGYHSWYKWATKNWKTKWNAYSGRCDPADGTFEFDTAWDSPVPVLDRLANLYPELSFGVNAIDEGLGFAYTGGYGPGFEGYEYLEDKVSIEAVYAAMYGTEALAALKAEEEACEEEDGDE